MSSESRLLSLLGLFASGRTLTATELAAQFGVTARTIRRDIASLRELGYVIGAVPGAAGGYRAESRTLLPPLQFDTGEALATAIGLALLRGVGLSASGAASASTKIRGMLPAAMRETVGAIGTAVTVLPGHEPEVDDTAVVTVASAIASAVVLTFTYTKGRGRRGAEAGESGGDRAEAGEREGDRAEAGERGGEAAGRRDSGPGDLPQRRVEPVQLVVLGAHWYLMAWDLDRLDWRVFRLDRMREVHATTFGFTRRPHPDAEATVRAAVTSAAYRHRVVLHVAAPAEDARRWFPARAVTLTSAPVGCFVEFGVDDLDWAAAVAARLPVHFRVVRPPEMVTALRALRDRVERAVESDGGTGERRTPPAIQ